MPNVWAQRKVEMILAWQDERQRQVDLGVHPSQIARLGVIISVISKAKQNGEHMTELLDYHLKRD